MTNDRGEYGNVKFLQGGSLFSRAPYGGSPAPNDGGWAYRGPRAFHGHEAPTYGRGGLWASKREAPLGRGGLAILGENTRGQYGSQPRVGASWLDQLPYKELSDAEMRAGIKAANDAMAPLVEERQKLLLAWAPTLLLTRDQMTKIMTEAVHLAIKVRNDLMDMIDKVPRHWTHFLTEPLRGLWKTLSDAPKFEALFASWTADPKAPVPGFRTWINHMLAQTEDGVGTIAYVGTVIPDWMRAQELASTLYALAVGAMKGVIGLAHGLGSAAMAAVHLADDVAKGLPTALKVAGVATLVMGGLWAVSKLTTQTTPAGAFSRSI